jgi:hypothetical protein
MSADWIATYRLQLHAGFPLSAAQEVLSYLAELGISHVYLSPCLQAVHGSQHGYDVTDPTRISADLGGEAAWTRFVECARTHGLKILLDIGSTLLRSPITIHGGTMCLHTDRSVRSLHFFFFFTQELNPFWCICARSLGPLALRWMAVN